MRVTIIRDDGVVGIDGVFKKRSMSELPEGVRAVQWDGSSGHIEHDDMTNTELTDISGFQAFIDAWNVPDPLPIMPAPDPRLSMAVTRFQAKAAMYNAGILDTVEAHFADPATGKIDKIAWDDAIDFYRLSPLVVSVGGLLGLTDAQLDQLFIDAAKVTI